MKNLLLVFLIILSVQLISYAEKQQVPSSPNQVILNVDNEPTLYEKHKAKFEARLEENSIQEQNTQDMRKKSYETLLYKDVNRMQPEKKALSKTIDKSISDNTSIGATYTTTEKSGELNDSVSVFSKYEKEKFSFTSAYSQNREDLKQNGVSSGSISLSPEFGLNKYLSVKNVYSENITSNQKKSEVVMSVKPFKDDRLDVDLGAGQSFSTDNQPAKSQVNLTTKIRF